VQWQVPSKSEPVCRADDLCSPGEGKCKKFCRSQYPYMNYITPQVPPRQRHQDLALPYGSIGYGA